MTDENNQIKFFLYENWARTKTGQHTVLYVVSQHRERNILFLGRYKNDSYIRIRLLRLLESKVVINEMYFILRTRVFEVALTFKETSVKLYCVLFLHHPF